MMAQREGEISWITFNNPERRNAVSLAMWAALGAIVRDYVGALSERYPAEFSGGQQQRVALVRPPSIQPGRLQSPGGAGRCRVPAQVALRAYLGECLDWWSWRVQSSGCESGLGRRKLSRWAGPCGWMSTSGSLC
jgi:hypothetical protein